MNESEVLAIEVDPGLPLGRVAVSLPMFRLKLLKGRPEGQKSMCESIFVGHNLLLIKGGAKFFYACFMVG